MRPRAPGPALLALLLAVVALAHPAAAGAAGRCGERPWCDTRLPADERAGLLLQALTPQERIGLLGGDDLVGVLGQEGTHTGTSNGVPRVGLPTTFYSDGPVGPRQGRATAMPIPMALAATFDPALARAHGTTIATEARAKGNDVVFAPIVNLMRTPLHGRTFEGMGEDPHLISRLAVEWIRGAQSTGVISNVKHYAVNNQEGETPAANASAPGQPVGPPAAQGNRFSVDARLDERTLRELYLPQFEAAVREANVGSVMCAYNRVNGPFACENEHLLEDILKGEWGFRGYVLADYGAAKSTINSLNNGLDFDPFPGIALGPPLVNAALASSQVSTDTVDEHVRRILRTLFAYGFFDRDAFVDDDRQIDMAANLRTAQQIAEASMTLLRNERSLLPLSPATSRRIAVIGAAADEFKTGGGSGNVVPFSFVTARQAIAERAGPGAQVLYDDGSDPARAAALARTADVALVFVGDYQTEFTDKACLTLQCPSFAGDQDGLVRAVAAAQPRTAVVLESGGPVLTPWRHEVGALLQAWYPGAGGGPAIARVLFGDVDPGGRLPVTFPRAESQYSYAGDREAYPGVGETVRYKEGVLVGYRHFDERGLEPAYPFGFGLSYTTFAYRDLRLEPAADGSPGATATVQVTNTGTRPGIETPQLYLGMPDPGPGIVQPPRQLRGSAKLALAPGQTGTARFVLDERAFSYWSTAADGWRVAPGCYDVLVGRSSRQVEQRGVLAQGGAACPGAPAPACEATSGLRSAAAVPRGRGALLRFSRRVRRSVDVDVFQESAGRRVLGNRLVARFRGRSRSFAWSGRANRRGRRVSDGSYVVRYRMRLPGGRPDVRRVALRRTGGRFARRPAAHRRASCDPLTTFKLERSVFGGRGNRALGIAFRLGAEARVEATVLRGTRVVRRFAPGTRRAARTHRLRLGAEGLRRGDYRVRLTVTSGSRRVVATLTARRL